MSVTCDEPGNDDCNESDPNDNGDEPDDDGDAVGGSIDDISTGIVVGRVIFLTMAIFPISAMYTFDVELDKSIVVVGCGCFGGGDDDTGDKTNDAGDAAAVAVVWCSCFILALLPFLLFSCGINNV